MSFFKLFAKFSIIIEIGHLALKLHIFLVVNLFIFSLNSFFDVESIKYEISCTSINNLQVFQRSSKKKIVWKCSIPPLPTKKRRVVVNFFQKKKCHESCSKLKNHMRNFIILTGKPHFRTIGSRGEMFKKHLFSYSRCFFFFF